MSRLSFSYISPREHASPQHGAGLRPVTPGHARNTFQIALPPDGLQEGSFTQFVLYTLDVSRPGGTPRTISTEAVDSAHWGEIIRCPNSTLPGVATQGQMPMGGGGGGGMGGSASRFSFEMLSRAASQRQCCRCCCCRAGGGAGARGGGTARDKKPRNQRSSGGPERDAPDVLCCNRLSAQVTTALHKHSETRAQRHATATTNRHAPPTLPRAGASGGAAVGCIAGAALAALVVAAAVTSRRRRAARARERQQFDAVYRSASEDDEFCAPAESVEYRPKEHTRSALSRVLQVTQKGLRRGSHKETTPFQQEQDEDEVVV
ncbi:hypothetical protein JKP88DRAFT_242885 [Tribonema minus]|uniref:Uncharacterized protein n=1 Tax=Tribonema minus TaxID=303371 RepID=A0A836CMS3_9STRA|nr:hypothetical protein JKP88DRAFT_242885 [Tribonema minus]